MAANEVLFASELRWCSGGGNKQQRWKQSKQLNIDPRRQMTDRGMGIMPGAEIASA
jgi:hypothetical protein